VGKGVIVLDTMVLVARPIHQLLGTLGAEGAVDVVWSDQLLAELVDVLERPKSQDGRGWKHEAAFAVAGFVRAGFPDGYATPDALTSEMPAARQLVNDPKDAHVVALAISQTADQIVTRNTKDYKVPDLAQRGVVVTTPDDFLQQLYDEIADEVIVAIRGQVTKSGDYPSSAHDILSLLHRAGCPDFAAKVCADLGLPAPDPRARTA
jgi:predicted nucleic acid-binding protein